MTSVSELKLEERKSSGDAEWLTPLPLETEVKGSILSPSYKQETRSCVIDNKSECGEMKLLELAVQGLPPDALKYLLIHHH
ncbi:hypothetical protein Tco_1077059, partial [Tanacetum coccineum]